MIDDTGKYVLFGLVIASLVFVYLLSNMNRYEIVTVFGLISSVSVLVISRIAVMHADGRCTPGFASFPFIQDHSIIISASLFIAAVTSATLVIRKAKQK